MHGFPDLDFFRNSNAELDDLCVPYTQALNLDGHEIMTNKIKKESPQKQSKREEQHKPQEAIAEARLCLDLLLLH